LPAKTGVRFGFFGFCPSPEMRPSCTTNFGWYRLSFPFLGGVWPCHVNCEFNSPTRFTT
jgi:hypothetical protein